MKKTLIAAVIAGGLLASSALAIPMSGTADIGRTPGTFGVTGGEYTITVVDPAGFNPFQSFCLEANEHILANPMNYELSFAAKPGGFSVGADGVPGSDPISKGTAWLFAQFAAGTLVGYDYNVGAGREASAYGLQLAIWNLEDETTFQNAAAMAFLALATAEFGADVKKADNGEQHVYAMNLFDAAGNPSQDMLAMGIPDGGSSVVLLGLALMGLGAISRRRLA